MQNKMTPIQANDLIKKISNWGRWGKDDQRGALNFITPAKRVSAARLVQTGETVSLALPLATVAGPDNPTPVVHLMIEDGHDAHLAPASHALDYIAMSPHGVTITHIDSLSHIFWQGKMYNGFDAGEVCYKGALKCGIDVARDGIVSRGVLLDVAKLRNVDWFSSGDSISAGDLDGAEKQHRVRVEEGDVLLVRTGRPKMRNERTATGDYHHDGLAGLDASCLTWLHERKIAILGTDTGADIIPSGWTGAMWGFGDDFELPGVIHVGTLVAMGVHLLHACDLEKLATVCSRLGRFEFMFNMAPLILERGTCSPVNPIALF